MRADRGFLDVFDPLRIRPWLSEAIGKPLGEISDPKILQGGTQNILIRFEVDGQKYVLRRPSLYAAEHALRAIEREHSVLQAIGGTPVPHPRLVAATTDLAVLGAPFYVMEYIEGFSLLVEAPSMALYDPLVKRALSFAVVDALCTVGEVDIGAVGLANLGKLEGYLERQVPRWAGQLEQYGQYAGWPGADGLPGIHAIAEWLTAHRPSAFVPGLMHGDGHIGNILFEPDCSGVAAILDWEMASLGDPLLDFARLLVSWPDESGVSTLSTPFDWSGYPSQADMVAHYRIRSGRDLRDLAWFEVLAAYKLAIVLEGTFARACAGLVSRNTGQRLHQSAVNLLTRALRRIGA